MNNEELIQFIKDNLTIKIELKQPYYDEGYLQVSLSFGDEIISESYEYVNLK